MKPFFTKNVGRLLAIAFLTIAYLNVQGQSRLKLGDNPGVIDNSAAFEIQSTNRGLLMPRMTTAEMTAIASPATGLIIYNTTENCIYFYFGGSWKSQCDPANLGAWGLLGNLNTNPTNNFLGTKDNVGLALRTNNLERVRISNTGEVGIGVIVPTNALHVFASANPLRIEGLQNGAAPDQILTVDATGVVRQRTVADILATGNSWLTTGNNLTGPATFGSITNQPFNVITNNIIRVTYAANGDITQVGNTFINTTGAGITNIGGATGTTNIDGNNLNIPNLPITTTPGTDEVVVVDPVTGETKKVTLATLGANSFTADNGLTKAANNVKLGGALIQPTVVTTSAVNTLALDGLQAGAVTDEIVTATSTGVLRKTNANTFVQANAWGLLGNTATNQATNFVGTTDAVGLTFRTNNAIRATISSTGEFGIGVVAPTNALHVNATANPLRLGGLQSGVVTDQLMTVDATGVVRQTTANTFVQDNAWALDGNSVTAIKTLGTKTNFDLPIITNNTEKVRIMTTGEVGIATATPNSTVQIAGSFSTAIRSITADATVGASDYTIVANCTSGAVALTLPDPATCAGRTYIIKKMDGANALNFSRPLFLELANSMNSATMSSTFTIQSDGSNWLIVNRF
jgi:hypothetical protein